jgi:hypothetical protein
LQHLIKITTWVKFILIPLQKRFVCIKVLVGPTLVADRLGLPENLGWSLLGLAHTQMFQAAGSYATAPLFQGQRMLIYLQ